MKAKLVAEGLGTFVLLLSVGCNVLSKNATWGSTSIGMTLMVMIYAFGGISGGHFNPAVSFCLALSKAMGGPGVAFKDAGMYSIVQIVAGILGAITYTLLYKSTFNLTPAPGFSWIDAALCEVSYTCMLCFVVLNVACAKGNANNRFYGLAIGFVVIAAGAYGAGMVSGGVFNPAVAFGVDLSSLALGFGWCIAYTIFELIGAVLAVILFKVVRPEDFGGEAGSLASVLASEFLGTMMLMLTAGLNVMGRAPDGAFSIAASLMCMIYALGGVSGAHFNPAVTAAIFVSGRDPSLTMDKAGKYVASQILGSMGGALIYSSIYNGASFRLGPGAGHGYLDVIVAEVLFTFVLCTVVLTVAVSKTTADPTMFGLAIASCVTLGVNAIGAISGGSLNPAVSLGIATAHHFRDGSFVAAVIYCIAELAAGCAAAAAYSVTHAVDKASEKIEESA